jgi:hypothetical protein
MVVYGRNDNYGYNLPKRVALSLNNFAELLDAPGDEIIFVDYNSPDSAPTFPEAIADTLTEGAKGLLRVIRVRPRDIPRNALNPKLKTNEPLARNVGFRRSNPDNRWVLSTNTDMIFLPKSRTSLSKIVSSLNDGQYGLPRFEIPETVWESMPRTDPDYVLHELDGLASRLNLRHIVTVDPPHIFDGPGDFQLFLRKDLFDIRGADEDMTKGWHVDSNLAKRVSFFRGEVVSLLDQLEGYHCDHTKQVTPAHKAGAESNSLLLKVKLVGQSSLEKQAHTWGLQGKELEEITLPPGNSLGKVNDFVSSAIDPQTNYSSSQYNSSGWDVNSIPTEHVIPFLADLFAHYPPGQQVIWIGPDSELRSQVLKIFGLMGLEIRLHEPEIKRKWIPLVEDKTRWGPNSPTYVVVFDFSLWSLGADQHVGVITRAMLRNLQALARKAKSRTVNHVIGINVVGNSVESEFGRYVLCATAPFSIGLRHGSLSTGRRISSIRNVVLYSRRVVRRIVRTLLRIVTASTGLRLERRLSQGADERSP